MFVQHYVLYNLYKSYIITKAITITIIIIIIGVYLGDPPTNLRGRKITSEITVVDHIPNTKRTKPEIAYRIGGSSTVVTIPEKWDLQLPQEGDPTLKLLVRIKIPHTKLTHIETYGLLVMADGLPIEKCVK